MRAFERLEHEIEAYLKGELSAEEASQLEEKASNDPTLANKIDVERSLFKGIEASRVNALKVRLNSLPTPPLQVPFYQTGAFKLGASVAGLVAAGSLIIALSTTNPEQAEVATNVSTTYQDPLQEDVIEPEEDFFIKNKHSIDLPLDNSPAEEPVEETSGYLPEGSSNDQEKKQLEEKDAAGNTINEIEVEVPNIPEPNSSTISGKDVGENPQDLNLETDPVKVREFMVELDYRADSKLLYSLNGKKIVLRGPYSTNYEIREIVHEEQKIQLIYEGEAYVLEPTYGRFKQIRRDR